jgi:hypothetical protein
MFSGGILQAWILPEKTPFFRIVPNCEGNLPGERVQDGLDHAHTMP